MKKLFTFLLIAVFTHVILMAELPAKLMPPAFELDCYNSLYDLVAVEIPDKENEEIKHYITGSNSFNCTAYGQIFRQPSASVISSVLVYALRYSEIEKRYDNIRVDFYELGDNGLPSTKIASTKSLRSIYLMSSTVEAMSFEFLDITLPQNFVAVVNMVNEPEENDQVVLLSSPQGCYQEGNENDIVAYTLLPESGEMGWISLNNLHSLGENSFDLLIELTVEEYITTNSTFAKENIVNVYPNPATDVVYVENATDSKVRMIDATGKVVIERTIQNAKESLEINQLEKGIYFLEISAEEVKSVNKIIKN